MGWPSGRFSVRSPQTSPSTAPRTDPSRRSPWPASRARSVPRGDDLMPETTDVLVVGGGAIGAAVAYFVRLHDPSVAVTVVERDPTYELASTPRASGGVRRLFSLPENITLSQYSIDFFEQFPAV